jgi:hypothetical protein
MSLTASDLVEIRNIVETAIIPIQNELEAIRNDLKEIYGMIADLQKASNSSFDKLTVEGKILTLYKQLLVAAKQAGVTLPK